MHYIIENERVNTNEFLFVSRNPDTRQVGSIYFKWGRLRLCHEKEGPAVEVAENEATISRYIAPKAVDYSKWLEDVERGSRVAKMDTATECTKIPNTREGVDAAVCEMHTDYPADFRQRFRVFELVDNGRHSSRGYPSVITDITDEELRFIHDSVRVNIPTDRKNVDIVKECNDRLRSAIMSKPALREKLAFS